MKKCLGLFYNQAILEYRISISLGLILSTEAVYPHALFQTNVMRRHLTKSEVRIYNSNIIITFYLKLGRMLKKNSIFAQNILKKYHNESFGVCVRFFSTIGKIQ